MIDKGTQAAAKKAAEWIQSPEGQEALRKTLQAATDLAERFRKATDVDPSILRRPMTI